MALKDELRANFDAFDASWRVEANTTLTSLDAQKETFADSYIKIATFQAWRTSVIENTINEDSAAFFFEGQNDLLVSHCLAHLGSFRQALKSLRSCIENVLFSLYYKDHPVELLKWASGDHKLGFTELITYLSGHPSLKGIPETQSGISTLKAEYSTLSKAVHASAKQFRMTTNQAENRLWVDDAVAVSMWAKREAEVIRALNLLLLHLFASHLQGAAHQNLRRVLSLVVPKLRHAQIKSALKINLSLST